MDSHFAELPVAADITVQLSSIALDLHLQSDTVATRLRIVQLAVKLFDSVAADIVRIGTTGRYRILATTDSGISQTSTDVCDRSDREPALAIPLSDGVAEHGVLRIFSPDEWWTPPKRALARAFGCQSALALQRAALSQSVLGLTRALESNRTIGMATGILMSAHKLTADQAIKALAKLSQDFNRKLRDVAELVLLMGRLPAPAELLAAAR